MQQGKLNVSLSNAKLGGYIPSVNMPPIITCEKCSCNQKCYATKGNYRFPSVKHGLLDNYNFYKENPEQFFNEVLNFLHNGLTTYKFFRWHASGDIVDENYFQNVVKVAKLTPQTQFLMFTKKYSIINEFSRTIEIMPSNLHIVFSAWDKEIVNPYHFPVAYVKLKDKSNIDIPIDAIPCTGHCDKCLACWRLQRNQSVVFNEH